MIYEDYKAVGPLTEAEVANWLKVKIFTLRKWRREGSGPPYFRCGNRLIRYSPDDVASWMNEKRFSSMANELSSRMK
jgi:predicted site-specific integrase-resolvase